jgi:hypothetical protein
MRYRKSCVTGAGLEALRVVGTGRATSWWPKSTDFVSIESSPISAWAINDGPDSGSYEAAILAAEARKQADRLACEAWNQRMLGYKGPAQPSPALGDVLNAGYLYLEVKCLGCNTHQTIALDIVRRAKTTPIHELERYMRCKDCSEVRGHPYKRSHLVALRTRKISASAPPSTWWPGER